MTRSQAYAQAQLLAVDLDELALRLSQNQAPNEWDLLGMIDAYARTAGKIADALAFALGEQDAQS